MRKRIGALAGALMLAGVASVAVTLADKEHVTVERVIDGDTIDVVAGGETGETMRVRLLNINSPEIGSDGTLDECFALDAKAHLEKLLPRGTAVSLVYDVEPQDRYDRELAGVFKDSTFINEEMVKAGLARAVLFEPNRKFYDRITAAEAAPKTKGEGVFAATGPCLFPTQDTRDLYDSIADDRAELDALDLNDPTDARRAAATIARLKDHTTRLKSDLATVKPFYSESIAEWLEEADSEVSQKEKRATKTLDREAKQPIS